MDNERDGTPTIRRVALTASDENVALVRDLLGHFVRGDFGDIDWDATWEDVWENVRRMVFPDATCLDVPASRADPVVVEVECRAVGIRLT